MRRFVALAFVLSLALASVSCGSPGALPPGAQDGSVHKAPGLTRKQMTDTAVKVTAAIKEAAAGAPWGKSMKSVEVVDYFRTPVVSVAVDGGDLESDVVGDAAFLLAGTMYPDGPYFVEVYRVAGGRERVSFSNLVRFGPKPPAPASSPDGIMAWIDAAYGPKSGDPVDESWYKAIKTIRFDKAKQTVVVMTDIPRDSPAAEREARRIAIAVGEAKAPGIRTILARFADGTAFASPTDLDNPYAPVPRSFNPRLNFPNPIFAPPK